MSPVSRFWRRWTRYFLEMCVWIAFFAVFYRYLPVWGQMSPLEMAVRTLFIISISTRFGFLVTGILGFISMVKSARERRRAHGEA